MIFLQKAIVQHNTLKTVLLYLLKVYPSLRTSARNQGTILASRSSEIDQKDDKTSCLFPVTCNISTVHTGNNFL